MTWSIPLFDTDIRHSDKAAVSRVLDSGWLSTGEEVAAFEKEFAGRMGSPFAVAVSSCTAALVLCLRALDLGPGDEVLCPSLNFCAGANAAATLGATPVFTDVCGQDDLCVSPADIERRITGRTRAVMVMHYAGYPCDMHAVSEIAARHGLPVIEDAAHAPGAVLDGACCGTLSLAGCFSFYPNKNMTTGEGGMVLCADESFAERLRRLRSHGMTSPTLDRHKGHAWTYDVAEPGFNFRLDEMRAALGRSQLARLDESNRARAGLCARYRRNLAGSGLALPFDKSRGTPSYHIQPALLQEGTDRPAFMNFLRERGIQTSIHYPPVHLFSWYRASFPGVSLPVTEALAPRLVTLPLFARMTLEQVDAVCEAALEFTQAKGALAS